MSRNKKSDDPISARPFLARRRWGKRVSLKGANAGIEEALLSRRIADMHRLKRTEITMEEKMSERQKIAENNRFDDASVLSAECLGGASVVEENDQTPPNTIGGGSGETLPPRVILPFVGDSVYTVEEVVLKKRPFYCFFKRFFDFFICLIALIVLLPLFFLIALIIKCTSKGPVFYVQTRLGYKRKPIRVPKFRSMRQDAEKNGAQWSNGDDDERIYAFGRFLRKTRLDELPQLWCCVIGTMSLVGPRPERACFAEAFEKYIHGFSERLKVRPGITGLAQVNGGYDLKPEEKIVYDVEYMKKRSFWLDVKILFKTVGIVFTHRGAK